MAVDLVQYKAENGIATITLDDPPVNGYTYDEYAAQFCPPNKASMAVGHIKRGVQSGMEVPLEYGLAIERELQAKLFASDDARTGLNAYVKKQKPELKGK